MNFPKRFHGSLIILAAVTILFTGCPNEMTTDTQGPTPGTAITFASITPIGITMSWGAATDNVTVAANLTYKLVQASATTSIDTVAKADAITGAGIMADWTANLTTKAITGLSSATSYAFAVLVKDEAGNEALYSPASMTTLCDVKPVERIITGDSHPSIRYLWYDCNLNSKEDVNGDTYIADYDHKGTFDRRVVYRDKEMIVDYFSPEGGNSPLWMWFIYDDRWHLTDFEYSQPSDQWESEHRNGFFALLRRSYLDNQWYPYGESPFCFFDTNADGIPEVALRFSTLYNPTNDACNYNIIWQKLEEKPRPLLCSVRLSFNLKTNPVLAHPYSYTLSFTIELLDPIDETPYLRTYITKEGRELHYFPKNTAIELAYRILSNDFPTRKRIGLAYEFEPGSFERWEGIIWYNDGVHNIANAGGPWRSTNRLQEFIDCTEKGIKLYYSDFDKMIHLSRADYSIQIKPEGDVYYSDIDADGYAESVRTPGNVVKIEKNQFNDVTLESLFKKTGLSAVVGPK